MVERGDPIGIEEAGTTPVEDVAVGVHPARVRLIAKAVVRDDVDGLVDGQTVAGGEGSQGVGEQPAVDVRRAGTRRAHGQVPRRDRRPLVGIEVVGVGEVDVRGDRAVSRSAVARRSVEDHVVEARRRGDVRAGHVAARIAATAHGLRPGELLGASRDPALRGDRGCRPLVTALEAVRAGRDRRQRLGVVVGDDPRVVDQDVAVVDTHGARAHLEDLASRGVDVEQRAPVDVGVRRADRRCWSATRCWHGSCRWRHWSCRWRSWDRGPDCPPRTQPWPVPLQGWPRR